MKEEIGLIIIIINNNNYHVKKKCENVIHFFSIHVSKSPPGIHIRIFSNSLGIPDSPFPALPAAHAAVLPPHPFPFIYPVIFGWKSPGMLQRWGSLGSVSAICVAHLGHIPTRTRRGHEPAQRSHGLGAPEISKGLEMWRSLASFFSSSM